MIKEAIDRILSLAPAERMEFSGVSYSTKAWHPIFKPGPEALQIHTLAGILDIHKSLISDLVQFLSIHIFNPCEVRLIGSLQYATNQRFTYATAFFRPRQFKFGSFLPLEDFIIEIQSGFYQNEDSARMLRLVGNLRDEAIKQNKDDGVTQTVVVKTGVTRVEEKEVVNPFILKPYRTFHEIEQPESSFILRLRQSQAALFVADYGEWELAAINSISEWFMKNITVSDSMRPPIIK